MRLLGAEKIDDLGLQNVRDVIPSMSDRICQKTRCCGMMLMCSSVDQYSTGGATDLRRASWPRIHPTCI